MKTRVPTLPDVFAAALLATFVVVDAEPAPSISDGVVGARITGKAASLLVRENMRYALATQRIGGGQGVATILEHA